MLCVESPMSAGNTRQPNTMTSPVYRPPTGCYSIAQLRGMYQSDTPDSPNATSEARSSDAREGPSPASSPRGIPRRSSSSKRGAHPPQPRGSPRPSKSSSPEKSEEPSPTPPAGKSLPRSRLSWEKDAATPALRCSSDAKFLEVEARVAFQEYDCDATVTYTDGDLNAALPMASDMAPYREEHIESVTDTPAPAKVPFFKSASVPGKNMDVKKPLRPILVGSKELRHTQSLGRKVQFNRQVQVFVYSSNQ